MFDVALSFNSQKLEFTNVNATFDDGSFCDALQHVLPDAPTNNDSSIAFKDSAQWFKDTLKNNNGKDVCNRNCFYKDPIIYEMKLLPVCQFLLNQYSLLSNQSSPQISVQAASAVIPKSAETSRKSWIMTFHWFNWNLLTLTSSFVILANEVQSSEGKNNSDAAISAESKTQILPSVSTVQAIANVSDISTTSTANSTTVKSTVASSQQQQKAVESLDEIAKPLNVTVQAKPVEPTSESSNKTETTNLATAKPGVELKPDDELKPGDELKPDGQPKVEDINVNLDGGEDNVNPFDNEGGLEETPDKDADPKVEFPYSDDEEDEYHDDAMARNNNKAAEVKIPQEPEPPVEDEVPHKKVEYVDFQEDPDSNFFTYLCGLMFLCILLYILHQNRHKILALFIEGRRGNRGRRGSRGGSKAAYSKLDCNLEEAITSKKSLSGKSLDIIY